MAAILIVLIVLGFVGHRVTTADERARLLRTMRVALGELRDGAAVSRLKTEPFRDALRVRTRFALVTPVLLAINVTVFVVMLFGAGSLSDPETLVEWGGNVGPRTTNAEWWRLVTSMFVHSGVLHLLVNVAGLIQVGFILERLVGPVAFAASYVAAGVFAGLVSLSFYPVAVSTGASGAIFGLYGLLIVSSVWAIVQRSTITIPLVVVKRLAPAATVFILFNIANDALGGAAEIAGLTVGFACGLVLTIDVGGDKAPVRRIATAMAVAIVIMTASAVTLRGITDVRSEMARVLAVEASTASAYEAAIDRYKKDRITPEALAEVIDRTIMPELEATQARLNALERVPREHQPLLATAEEYLRLRHESWRLRAEGLRKVNTIVPRETRGREPESDTSLRLRAEARHRANMLTLARAETTERVSLETLKKLRTATGPARDLPAPF